MDLSTFGGHHHFLFLRGLLATQVRGPSVYIYTSWKKRSKVSSSNQKRPLKPNWHTGSRGGASTNSQFHKRPKGSLEKWAGNEDEATPHFLFCWGLSMTHRPLSWRDVNASNGGHTHEQTHIWQCGWLADDSKPLITTTTKVTLKNWPCQRLMWVKVD